MTFCHAIYHDLIPVEKCLSGFKLQVSQEFESLGENLKIYGHFIFLFFFFQNLIPILVFSYQIADVC